LSRKRVSVCNGFFHVPDRRLISHFVTDELDSYLYQSVGTSLVTLIAKAMRLPLYRKTITGKPVHLESTYGSRTKERSAQGQEKTRVRDGIEGDETEDLDELLHEVKV
jgi:diphthine-ammonia ligase